MPRNYYSRYKKTYKTARKLGKFARKTFRGFRKFVTRYQHSRSVLNQASSPTLFVNSYTYTLTGNATGTLGTGIAKHFKFDDIGDRADIMDLYDVYRIEKIDIRYIPAWNVAANTGSQIAAMYYVFDPVDDTTPTSNAEMLNYSRVHIHPTNKPFTFSIVPAMMQSIGVVASNEYSTVKTNTLWLTNTDTKSYGFKLWVDPINVNSAPIGTIIYTYHISAKYDS